jgi:Leucine-rich repeat (LRR) protein
MPELKAKPHYLNLAFKTLNEIPSMSNKEKNTFAWLILYYNNISTIGDEIEEFHQLTVLDLLKNPIKNISPKISKISGISKKN